MASSLLASAKCESCNTPGAAKGKDEHGHIHCRLCWCRKHNDSKATKPKGPAEGNPWIVYCYRVRKDVAVLETAPNDSHEQSSWTIIESDNGPAAFRAPKDMFRGACRMITVTVGKVPAVTTFMIHEPLLTSSSAYFQRALKSTFKEGNTGQVNLEEDDPQVFGLINEYLYTGTIAAGILNTNFLRCFSELWLLAHYLQMSRLVNYAIWRLVSWTAQNSVVLNNASESKLGIRDVGDLYERAPVESKLRKFLVDLLIWEEGDEEVEMSDQAPMDMMRDGIREAKRKADKTLTSPLLDVRNYHTEEEELVQVVD